MTGKCSTLDNDERKSAYMDFMSFPEHHRHAEVISKKGHILQTKFRKEYLIMTLRNNFNEKSVN
jgi:hypothetical protein